jgi:hypothetical protein
VDNDFTALAAVSAWAQSQAQDSSSSAWSLRTSEWTVLSKPCGCLGRLTVCGCDCEKAACCRYFRYFHGAFVLHARCTRWSMSLYASDAKGLRSCEPVLERSNGIVARAKGRVRLGGSTSATGAAGGGRKRLPYNQISRPFECSKVDVRAAESMYVICNRMRQGRRRMDYEEQPSQRSATHAVDKTPYTAACATNHNSTENLTCHR